MSSKLEQWSGPALAAGGSLWIAHYALQVVTGAATGVPPVTRAFDTPVAVLDLFFLSGAILLSAVGLLGIGARPRGRSRKLKAAGTAFVLMLVVALSTGAASAAVKVGTDGAEALVGTRYADHLTGKGGDDFLDGRAGNDVYHFAGGFGSDTLVEPRKVGTSPGGVDTLSFSGTGTGLVGFLIPQWAAQGTPGYNWVYTQDPASGTTHRVSLGSSVVEKAVGGSGDDLLFTGAGANTLKGGAGGADRLTDNGGHDGDGARLPALPASDDAYGGFAAGPGVDSVYDFGGAADVLDLRPWESSDVYVDAISAGADDPKVDTLVVSAGDRGVVVYGHFAPLAFHRGENGTMEKIVFADETITGASAVRALAEGPAGDAELRAAAAEAPAPPSPATLPGPPTR